MDVCYEREKIDETPIRKNADVCLQGKNETEPSERKWPIKIDTNLVRCYEVKKRRIKGKKKEKIYKKLSQTADTRGKKT